VRLLIQWLRYRQAGLPGLDSSNFTGAMPNRAIDAMLEEMETGLNDGFG
jgi:hypothetical protein